MCLVLNDLLQIFSQLKERRLHHCFVNEDNLYLINGMVKLGGLEFLERTNKIKLTEREYLKFSGIKKHVDYIAPEILIRKKLSMNMNLYSFGVLVYKLLFNVYPFQGKFDGTKDLILMYKNEICKLDFCKKTKIRTISGSYKNIKSVSVKKPKKRSVHKKQ
jgi:hypothetical protein